MSYIKLVICICVFMILQNFFSCQRVICDYLFCKVAHGEIQIQFHVSNDSGGYTDQDLDSLYIMRVNNNYSGYQTELIKMDNKNTFSIDSNFPFTIPEFLCQHNHENDLTFLDYTYIIKNPTGSIIDTIHHIIPNIESESTECTDYAHYYLDSFLFRGITYHYSDLPLVISPR